MSENSHCAKVFLYSIWDDGEVREARIFRGSRPILNGFFDNPDDMLKAIRKYSTKNYCCYTTINPVLPELLFRKNKRNQLSKCESGSGAANTQVTELKYLFIDCDPERPIAGISSSDEELKEAQSVAKKIIKGVGKKPLCVSMSGNGYHIIFRHNSKEIESEPKIKKYLEMLEQNYSSENVKIDLAVTNPARILKIPGQWSTKGENCKERPHRKSRLEEHNPINDIIDIASIEVSDQKTKENIARMTNGYRSRNFTQEDGVRFVEEFIHKHSIPYRSKRTDAYGKVIFTLEHCHFNPDHAGKDASIVIHTNGVLGYNCFHKSCGDKYWSTFREIYDPKALRQKSYREENYDYKKFDRGGPTPEDSQVYDIKTQMAEIEAETADGGPGDGKSEHENIPFSFEDMHPTVRRYVLELGKFCDAPWEFLYFSTISAIGAALGNKVWMTFQKNMYPNLYFLIIAKSTIFRKSASIKMGQTVIRDMDFAMKESYERDLQIFEERYNEWANTPNRSVADRPTPPVDDSIFSPNDITPEYLIDVMAAGDGSAYLSYSEMGSLLATSNKSYMSGYKQLLTDMYDCGTYIKGRKSDKRNVFVKTPCPSIIAASTIQWLKEYLSESELLSGFLSRFLFVVKNNIDREIIPLPDKLTLDSYWSQHFFPSMLGFKQEEFYCLPEAKREYAEHVMRNVQVRKNEDAFLESFIGRSEASLLKLSLIFHCIDTVVGHPPSTPSYKLEGDQRRGVTDEAFHYAEKAINFCNKCIRSSIDQIAGGNTDDIDKFYETLRSMYRNEPDKVQEGNKKVKCVNSRRIYRRMSKRAKDAKEIIETLQMQGRIVIIKDGKSTYIIPKK